MRGDTERWGEMGRDGEMWGDVGRDGEMWGEMGRYGETWDMGRSGGMWGDVGEMWRQAGAHHVVRLGHALDAVAEEVGVRLVGVEEERLFTARVCVKRRCSQAGARLAWRGGRARLAGLEHEVVEQVPRPFPDSS